jgi:hypothetical protein
MATLISLTCNSKVNNAGDMIFLHVNGTRVATLFFGGAATKSFSSPLSVGNNALLELLVRINTAGVDQSMGTKTAAFNPSPIPYLLGLGNYGLNYV